MPVYSISRTSQYTTVAALETKANQDGYSWNGFDLSGYSSNFTVNYLTVCPIANRTWNYSIPASPTANHVWYPYQISLAISGGEPQSGDGDRVGLAYLKLFDSAGTYLMGSYTTNSLANGGQIWNGASVQATSFYFTNSRNTILLTANTLFYAGFAAPSTTTPFYNIFARTTGQTGQNVYQSNLYTSTANAGTGNLPTVAATTTSNCIMGYITYNASPPQPTNLIITTTNTGISIICQSNEAQSYIPANALTPTIAAGEVVSVRFFYSETLLGTYLYLGIDISITRTLISGTTYQYTATFEGGSTLTQGRKYFFKVATMNDVCIAYESENTGSIPASQQSTAVEAQYGKADIIKKRNLSNTLFLKSEFKVRDNLNLTWSNAKVAKRDATNSFWVYN
jgi:hypothetical protein